jgi:hypothetical protein
LRWAGIREVNEVDVRRDELPAEALGRVFPWRRVALLGALGAAVLLAISARGLATV